MGVFSSVCSGVLWGRGGLQFRVQDGEETLFSFWVGGEEKTSRTMEFELCFHSMSVLQTALISILYKQSLQWWFRCMRLQTCVGSVCVGGTALMYRGRECSRMGSATRRVSFYESLVGGGLSLSWPSSGNNGSVRVYRRVIFGKQNWRCARTLCTEYI